jgi:hypothetical protein
MRRQLLVGIALALLTAVPGRAQDAAERRFTQPPIDPNRNHKVIYVPLGWKFPGARPATQPYDVSAASWYQQRIGARDRRPDNVLDGAEYTLERFDVLRGAGGQSQLRVVIFRRPSKGDSSFEGLNRPELQIVDTRSRITATGYPQIERADGGTRYTYVVLPPSFDFTRTSAVDADRFELRFLPASEVRLPRSIVRAPTFGGYDVQTRMSQGPPRVRTSERVAGSREEFKGRK